MAYESSAQNLVKSRPGGGGAGCDLSETEQQRFDIE